VLCFKICCSLLSSYNIFVGQTEAPLLIRPFIAKATKSELMAIMCGGFAQAFSQKVLEKLTIKAYILPSGKSSHCL